jgi:hypothetical protein
MDVSRLWLVVFRKKRLLEDQSWWRQRIRLRISASISDHELVVLELSYQRLEEEPVVKYYRDLKCIDVAGK